MFFHFIVPGPPTGKGRPKFCSMGKFSKAYTPAKTKAAKLNILTKFKNSYPGARPLAGALSVKIQAIFGVPKNSSRKLGIAMLEGSVKPTKKPDIDNIVKLVLDALNGHAFTDDANVVELVCSKRYGSGPAVSVEIVEIVKPFRPNSGNRVKP